MSVASGPKINTDGLVFSYDMTNYKSYKGPPISNIANNLQIIGTGSATGYSSVASIQTEEIPELGSQQVYINTIQNNYTSFTPNSGSCCPSLHSWGGISVLPSTLYTYGIVYRCDSGYTSSNYMYRYEYTSNGGSYVAEGGVFNNNNRISLGSNWYYAWGTFTTQPTTTWLGHCGTFYYRYSPYADRLSVAKVMIAQGNYAGMHPQYWPSTNSTKTNTETLKDISGINSTVTANNLNYSGNTFTFNGSNSYLDCGNLPQYQLTTAVTLEAWVKPNSSTGLGNMISKNMNGGYRFRIQNGELMSYSNGSAAVSSGANLSNGSWWHCVATFGPNGQRGYVNGNLVASNGTAYTPSDVVSNPLLIGCYWPGAETFDGIIDIAKVYNRVLTADEVSQNFNALRGRYGI